jgi:hypothetical protein
MGEHENEILDKVHQRPAEKEFGGETQEAEGNDDQDKNEEDTAEL